MADIWDQLAERIVNPQDRVLFDEATNSARSGAIRTSYIAVWLSCAESLKRKFKEAAQTDAVAAKVGGDIDTKENNHQAIDAFILGKAKEYGFISDAEFSQLENVYAQRCIYGHPYEQAPLPAQLHAAATVVIEYVLGRPTKLRHGYLSRQVDLICKAPTYLDDHYPAIDNCAQVIHLRSSSDIHLWFLQKVWQEFGPMANDPAMGFYFRRVTWFTTAFLSLVDAEFYSTWDAVQDLTRFPFLSSSLATPALFPRVNQHAQDIIIGNLLGWAQTQTIALKLVQDLNDANVLTQRQVDRFQAAIASLPDRVLASAGIHPSYYVAGIIEHLCSYTWDIQNPAVDTIRTLGPEGISKLDVPQQMLLGNNVLQAADGRSNTANSFLADLGTGAVSWPETFIEGIIAECVVNAENCHRFKTDCADIAMLSIRATDPAIRTALVGRIVARLQASLPKYPLSSQDRDSILAAIDAAVSTDAAACTTLLPLRQTVLGLALQ